MKGWLLWRFYPSDLCLLDTLGPSPYWWCAGNDSSHKITNPPHDPMWYIILLLKTPEIGGGESQSHFWLTWNRFHNQMPSNQALSQQWWWTHSFYLHAFSGNSVSWKSQTKLPEWRCLAILGSFGSCFDQESFPWRRVTIFWFQVEPLLLLSWKLASLFQLQRQALLSDSEKLNVLAMCLRHALPKL